MPAKGVCAPLLILVAVRAIAPVHAVYGNTDPPEDPRLTAELVWQAGGLRIHVSHGHELGSPTPAALAKRYTEDVLVYGHTHVAAIRMMASVGSTIVGASHGSKRTSRGP